MTVLQRLVKNPDFNALNERQAQRILRQKFNGLSKTNAQRIIRTESTLAANYATQQTAIDAFGINNLEKEWFAAMDERTRAAHAAADGQIVDANRPFIVGGEELMMLRDVSGSPSNVIKLQMFKCFVSKPEPETVQSDLLESPSVRCNRWCVAQEIIE